MHSKCRSKVEFAGALNYLLTSWTAGSTADIWEVTPPPTHNCTNSSCRQDMQHGSACSDTMTHLLTSCTAGSTAGNSKFRNKWPQQQRLAAALSSNHNLLKPTT
jgi:hypothetical protein